MHHLAGQVMILLVAIISPNDSVSYTPHPGSLIWPQRARERAHACMHACGADTRGQEGEWWKGAMWSVAGRQWDAGCRG